MTLYTNDPQGLIAGDGDILHESRIIISGQTLTRGALLGMITASKKLTLSLAAATDGSETPIGILAVDCDASGGDKKAPVYFSGEFVASKVTYGTGHTAATANDAFRANGAAIFLRDIGTVA